MVARVVCLSDVLTDIVRHCEFMAVRQHSVIIQQGDRGHRSVYYVCHFPHAARGRIIIIIIIIIYSFIKNSTISVYKMHTKTGQKANG